MRPIICALFACALFAAFGVGQAHADVSVHHHRHHHHRHLASSHHHHHHIATTDRTNAT